MYPLHALRLAVLSDSDASSNIIAGLLSALGVSADISRFESLDSVGKSVDTNSYDALFIWENLFAHEKLATELLAIVSQVQTFVVHSGEARTDLLWNVVPETLEHLFLPTLTPSALLRAIRDGIRLKRKERELEESNSALLRSEKRYRTLVENSIDGIELLDAEARIIFINAAVIERLLGFRAETIIGRSAFDFVHPDDQAKAREAVAAVIANPGQVLTLEFRVYHANGSIRWVEAVAMNRLQDPEVHAIVLNHRDITEKRTTLHELQKRNEQREKTIQALRESEEKYRLLFERSLGGVFLAAIDGKIIDCNESFARSLGFEHASEVINQNLFDYFITEDSKTKLRQMLSAGNPILSEELNINRRDGCPAALMSNLTVVERGGSPTPLIQGSTIDFTEHRELKRQMANVQKMEEIGRLVGGISHDFNNMIMIMTSYSELVLDSLEPDDPAREHIQQILSAADRGSSLVRQLLAFSRKQVLDPINLDLNHVVTDMATMLPRLLGEDIAIDLHPSAEPAIINVDCSQLEQILLNLSVNARDAMPQGGKLTVETAHVELDLRYSRAHVNMRPGRYIMLAVSDTGQGIDRKVQSRIFEPFFTTKARGKGSGLGLSTVYGIVKQSDGYIWVYSEPGHGTTFKIYFPQVDAPAEQELQKKHPEQYSGTETILFVEDEASLRRPACDFLSGQGYRVLEAGTGSEALAIAESEPHIDALVTDVVMPGWNGRETASAIVHRHPEARVLYISGYTDNVLSSHGVQPSGAFLQKPCALSSLARKVREILDHAGSGTRADAPHEEEHRDSV